MRRLLALGLTLAAVVAGCGGKHAASASPEQVVRAWNRALNDGNNERAADLFAKNAQIAQAGVTYRLKTREEATNWNATLPCGGRIVALTVAGTIVTATFLLTDRKTSTCDAPGQKANAAFTIEHGRITVWRQISENQSAGGAV